LSANGLNMGRCLIQVILALRTTFVRPTFTAIPIFEMSAGPSASGHIVGARTPRLPGVRKR
jgi:hypothetical protein